MAKDKSLCTNFPAMEIKQQHLQKLQNIRRLVETRTVIPKACKETVCTMN